MCEQTEINYLDGDVVWVKLGSYWWPGQVIGIEKLPEDIQIEFKKKPIIAAVKFFQEDSFEFVKNYQQIYKYNCRQKEEFIRKGLDKYRVKSKDGFNYMDKFPEDVKTAEILTNGDPYILLNKKFNPEEKPDISGLFGEKKIVKKKRNREDLIKKINNDIPPRVTHPRFLQENDHEVRIRQQPKTLPLSSSTYSSAGIYPCHVCGFTATRVNVIICHLKNHRLNKETEGISKSKLKGGMHLKQKHTNLNLPKRKYIRKLVSCKIKNDNVLKLGKRKYCKQIEKPIKKKKSDPELREKLLADWNVDTDEDESSYFDKSTNDSSVDLSNNKLSYLESTDEAHILKMKSVKYNSDSIILLQASNKILRETDSLTNLSMLEEDERNLDKINIEQTDMEKTNEDIHINNIIIEKSFLKDDKKSRLSCFDFDEDDVPEPSISSVRKIPRSLGSKNMSIKKEIIKEFQMSQALLTDEEILFKNNEINEVNKKINKFTILDDKIKMTDDVKNQVLEKEENICQNSNKNIENKFQKSQNICETHLEIVEIFEVEKENLEIKLKKDEKNETDKEAMKIKNISKPNVQEDIELKITNEETFDIKVESELENEVPEILSKDKIEFDHLNKNKIKEIKENECKDVTLVEKEVNNLHSQFLKNNISNQISILETKHNFNALENQCIISEKFISETKYITDLPVNYKFENQNNSQMEILPTESTLDDIFKVENKNTIIKDNINFAIKKRRGRPKKKKAIIEDVSDDEYLKSDNLKKKSEIKKISSTDSNCSYDIRKQKSNQKNESLYLPKSDYRLSKNNESLSENDDKVKEIEKKMKADTKLESKETNTKLIDEYQHLNLTFDKVNNINSIECDIMENTVAKKPKIQSDISVLIDILQQSKDDVAENNKSDNAHNKNNDFTGNYNLKNEENIDNKVIQIQQINEKMYIKKNQIKKFEPSKINVISSNSVKCLITDLNNHFHKASDDKKNIKNDISIESNKTQNESSLKLVKTCQSNKVNTGLNKEINKEVLVKCKEISTNVKNKLVLTKSVPEESSNSIHYMKVEIDTEKHISDTTLKFKKGKFDDNQFDSFQDAFIKTLQIDNSLKQENVSEIQKLIKKKIELNDTKKALVKVPVPNFIENPIITNFSITDNFNNVEVAVADSSKIEEKSKEKDPFINDKNIIIPLNNKSLNNKNNNLIMTTANLAVNEDNKKIDVPINSILTTLSSTIDMKNTVPVKKREKPRIIENVALKEPMILKTKLMEKHIGKIGKHKLESENIIDELKKISKAKLMKMETVISNSKSKFHTISNTNIRNQQIIAALPQTVSRIPYTEKYIQQSSQSLVDMDLDINSMPFVLSEDVLTPESIEQMPVVISSVLPAKVPITTLSTTLITSKETYSAHQSFDSVKDRSEICSKKKTGMPTILKNKNKVKPTITSIKTIVPPLSNTTYKGNFKLNTQALTSLDNKKIPGKYVIVQTSGHQQAYSTHPKVSIPTSKGSGNAQIVQQGSKVVILTSSQSGQSGQKVLPLNSISKALNTGNVQRIITSKQGPEMYNSISSKNFISCKNISASSSDLNSSMSSKLAGQKILGQQQIISSKTILTQVPGAITKSTILGTLPQGILTKEGIFTPINTSTLGGKTIISSKTLVTKGFPHQSINTPKNSLTQSLSSKAIINSQGIVSKGTILTPITGSQVKALAAKNIKGNKLQYQIDQHKVQLGGIQKHSNVPMSSSLVRSSTNFKTSSSVMVLQKADLKTITSNKKHIKQTVQKQISETTVLTPPTIMSIQQKSKGSTDLEQKIISSKNINHSINLQQKILAEKDQDTKLNSVVNNEALALKTIFEQKKQIASTLISKSNKGTNKMFHKKISNVANSVTLSSNANANLSMTIPSLEPINHEKVPKKEDILEQISSKKETIDTNPLQMDGAIESTINVQSQIMALPTENSDGTQTYVLVTVDEQGHIVPLDNNALMSLEETSNLDENRTLYIDSSSLPESGNVDNIILQIDNGSLSNIQTTNVPEPVPSTVIETLPSIQNTQTTNQDILAAALANTDFQQEISVLDCSPSTTITNLTQTSLINQTILQSTIIPPTEPISSPLVLETSLTLNQPIMTPLEIPSTLSIQSELTPVTSITTVPTSLALPVTENNQNISYIIAEQPLLQISEKPKETKLLNERVDIKGSPNAQCKIKTDLLNNITDKNSKAKSNIVPDLLYSFSVVQDDKQIQTIPSMPIIDDTFNANNGFDSTNTSVIEDKLKNYITKTSEELIQDLTENDSLQESNENLKNSSDKICSTQEIISETPQIIINHIQDDSVSSQENTNLIKQSQKKVKLEHTNKLNKIKEKLNTAEDNTDVYAASSESSNKIQSRIVTNEASEATVIIGQSTISQESLILNEELPFKKQYKETKLMKVTVDKEETIELNKKGNVCHTANLSVKDELNQVMLEEYKITFLDEKSKTNKEIPTQSYKQFISASSNIINDPSQSEKFENLQKTTKSFSYESLKTDQNTLIEEVSTQTYKDSKQKESFQSHKNLSGINTNTPTQSFKEMMTLNDKTSINKCIDDSNFSNQNFNIEKIENYMKTETDIGQECPSQSNDICVDGIGTSSTSINNLVLNEDETASSSYVPETPENQERDQDQESAISTSSYEIPTCEELNISSSNVIPNTSIQSEHSSIHNNGVPEIPTSSYNLNPDSSSTHIIAVPTSSYEDEIIIEQNVSTSYEVPISIGNLEKTGLRNYVTDGSEHRNEASNYYPHEEVTESYYESMCKRSSTQLESNSEEEAAPSYYESNSVDVTSETSQNYFNQDEVTHSYDNHDISSNYYDSQIENEASASFYSTHELDRSAESTLQNVETTQNFYQNRDGQFHEQEEAIPTYTDRYSLDYVPINTALDRHDLVDSSITAKSMDR